MKIYCFSSDSLTNIWAGVGSGVWAVGKASDPAYDKGRRTKASKMPIGALGVLYCKETNAYTTPFLVYSKPDPEAIISNVWADPWVLPFNIKPLGNPTRSLSVPEACEVLPSMSISGNTDPRKHLITVQGNFAFQSSTISEDDWSALIGKLAI